MNTDNKSERLLRLLGIRTKEMKRKEKSWGKWVESCANSGRGMKPKPQDHFGG